MNAWLAAVIALLPALCIPAFMACRGGTLPRFIAVQLVASIAVLILVSMTFAFDQSSFIDLSLCAALLNLPSSLLIALMLERWL